MTSENNIVNHQWLLRRKIIHWWTWWFWSPNRQSFIKCEVMFLLKMLNMTQQLPPQQWTTVTTVCLASMVYPSAQSTEQALSFFFFFFFFLQRDIILASCLSAVTQIRLILYLCVTPSKIETTSLNVPVAYLQYSSPWISVHGSL